MSKGRGRLAIDYSLPPGCELLHFERSDGDSTHWPPNTVEVEDEDDKEYEMRILNVKLYKRFKYSPLRFEIEWISYEHTDESKSTVGSEDLARAKESVKDFYRLNPTKPGSYEQFLEIANRLRPIESDSESDSDTGQNDEAPS